jgi:hypothetical protein
MLKYADLKNKPKELLAATGLKQEEIEALLVRFSEAYTQRYRTEQTVEGESRQRRVGGGRKGKLTSLADKLLFILIYEKTVWLESRAGQHLDSPADAGLTTGVGR